MIQLKHKYYKYNCFLKTKIQNSLLVKKLITIFSDRARIIGLGSEKEIFLKELKMFPPFVRFKNVWLLFWRDSLSIEERCEWFESQLVSLKSALNDLNMLEFNTNIGSNDKGDFNNHSQLLEHLCNRMLPICNSSRG